MTKNQISDVVGDTKSPPLQATVRSLTNGTNQGSQLKATATSKAAVSTKSSTLGKSMRCSAEGEPEIGTCVQTLWFSFFFDGTGNNLDADIGTSKHSNVTKLYRVHVGDGTQNEGRKTGKYRIYIPGVGTYFKDVGDDGGSTRGLAMGDLGDKRLTWALDQFKAKLDYHAKLAANPKNAIVEINLSAFGFSRGAALARAFIRRFVLNECKQDSNKSLRLNAGGYKVRIRFMGLFDTVASVGLPMSGNNLKNETIPFGVKTKMWDRLRSYPDTRPERLAFAKNAKPGADPAPGSANGHLAWGDDMEIPEIVESVRHFIAAHEIRNSFPVDSISVLKDGTIFKPAHFQEFAYPGVHSDIGGSYRPGEGARSDKSFHKLGLIPLKDMYISALDNGVPLLSESAWKDLNKDDFETSPTLLKAYNDYLSKVKPASTVGDLFNAHMGLYYAWRFRSIHRKQNGDNTEAEHIAKNDKEFDADRKKLDKEISQLEAENDEAVRKYDIAITQRSAAVETSRSIDPYDQKVVQADRERKTAQDNLLRAKAKRDALPGTGSLKSTIDTYDEQLIADAKAILHEYRSPARGHNYNDQKKRAMLRPHYMAMMDTYEDEFLNNKGLKDQTVIDFFDNYVHDSLAGFAKDATLPSDPRVIYLGGSEKYQYAKSDSDTSQPISENETATA